MKDKYNPYLEQLKSMTEYLYESALVNEDKQEKRAAASYREMISIKEAQEDLQDNFQDFSKLESQLDVVRYGKEFSLGFKAIEREFLAEYYSKKVYPMAMTNGYPIPGSLFNEIFNDNTKYWGFVSDEISLSSFELRLQEKQAANKIYLSTTHDITVKAYAKSNFDDDYVYLGERSGIDHVWNFWPTNVVSVKFESDTNAFAVRYVSVALCQYRTHGTITTESFDIDDLYKLRLEVDSDVPSGTSLEFYGVLNNNRFKLSQTDVNIITGGVEWLEYPPAYTTLTGSGVIPYPSGYPFYPDPSGTVLPTPSTILPSGYLLVPSGIMPSGTSGLIGILPYDLIEDSVIAHSGYKKWNIIDSEIDYVWEDFDFSVNPFTGVVNILIPNNPDFIIPLESVKNVYTGTTDSKREFEKGVDYGVISTPTTLTLDITSDDMLNASNLTAEVLLRVATPIRQVRTYVNSIIEKSVGLDFSGISGYVDGVSKAIVRVATIDGMITDEILFETTNDSATVTLNPGTTLIELEFYTDASDEDTLFLPTATELDDMTDDDFKDLDYFAYNYLLDRVLTDNVDDKTYYLDELDSQYEANTVAEDVFLRYATTEDNIDFKLEIVFKGTGGWITPTLRSYKMVNSIT